MVHLSAQVYFVHSRLGCELNHSEGVGDLAWFFRATRRKFALEPTMQEIGLDQRWSEGLKEVTVTSVFGVRLEIRWNETNDVDEISEADFRKRFSFVASK
jgi:hypothetical protein